jgi:hypothetical protein
MNIQIRFRLSLVALTFLCANAQSEPQRSNEEKSKTAEHAEPVQAPTSPLTDEPTGIVFPLEAAGMRLINTHTWKDAKLGRCYSYRTNTMKADIYLYTAGRKNIPDGLTDAVREEFKEALDRIKRCAQTGTYVRFEQQGEFAETPMGARSALIQMLAYEQDEVPRISRVLLTAHRDHFLQVRFTWNRHNDEAGREAFDAFVKMLATAGGFPAPERGAIVVEEAPAPAAETTQPP